MPDVQEWVWVKDLSTGYRYDIPASFLDEDGRYEGVQVIAAKPRHFGPNPRRPKYPVDVDTGDGETRTTETTDATASGADAAPAASTNEE